MKHTALTPRCGGCGSPSCPSCDPEVFLSRAQIAKVISDWLNEYGVDAKSEDLNWKDLEDRLTDLFSKELEGVEITITKR